MIRRPACTSRRNIVPYAPVVWRGSQAAELLYEVICLMRRTGVVFCAGLLAALGRVAVAAPVQLIIADIWEDPIRLTAQSISTWKEKGQPRGFLFEGEFRWIQGELQVDADRAIAWFDAALAQANGEAAVDIYAEGRVTIMQEGRIDHYERVLIHASSSGAGAALYIVGAVRHLKAKPTTSFVLRGEAKRASTYTDFASKEPVIETPKRARLPKFEQVTIPKYRDFSVTEDKQTGQMIFTIIGPVEIHRRDVVITADNIIVWARLKKTGKKAGKGVMRSFEEFYAEGNVTVTRGKDRVSASRVYENVRENKGVYYDARLALESGEPAVYCQAKVVWHTGKGQFEAANASVSTCDMAVPHYDVRGKMVRIIQTPEATVVSSVHNFLRIRGIPVAYVPSITHDIHDREFVIRSARVGNSDDKGTFVETRWNANQLLGVKSKKVDMDLLLDYYGERGLGLGLDVDYVGADYFGGMKSYFIRDDADVDHTGVEIAKQHRWRFLWRHRQELGAGWRAEAELSYISDRGFLPEYFEDEFKEGKDQETLLYLRKLNGNKGFRFTLGGRLNTFDTQVERQPLINFDVIGQPFWKDAVVYTGEYQAGMLHRSIDTNLHVRNPDHTLRFHTSQEFAVPFKLWITRFSPFYRMDFTAAHVGRDGPLAPRTGLRKRGRANQPRTELEEAAAERELVGESDKSPVARMAHTVGVRASSDFWRVFDVESKWFDVNRIKHVMTPEVEWEYTPKVFWDGPAEFNQFDEVDRIDDFHRIMVGYRQRFLTKRGRPGEEHTSELLLVDTELNIYPGNAGRNAEYDDWLGLDVSWSIRDWLWLQSMNNEFNFSTGRWEVVSGGVKVDLAPKWSFYLGHTYIRDTSSALTFEVEHRLNDRWTIYFYEQYDFDYQLEGGSGSENLNTALTLRRRLHKWSLDIKIEQDKGQSDNRISVALTHVGSESKLRRY